MFTNIQVAVFRLAHRRGDVIRPNEPLVADDSPCSFEDRFRFRFLQLSHVITIARDRLRHEGDIAGEIGDNQGSVASRLVFPRPQFTLARPGPAWPQSAVY